MVTDTSITSYFYITYAIFQTRYAYTQAIQLIGELICQAVNHSLLFSVSTILVSHSFSYHLSHFITSDIVLAFESAIWITINDTSLC